MRFNVDDIGGMKITVMGLGLNGGGFESVKFFASRGAQVTATDLRNEAELKPTIDRLSGLPVRYVLGRHELTDFENADMVIKNPAVKWDSPFIRAAERIETDISIFLKLSRRPLIAVTGSKGKSTTVSALHYALKDEFPNCDLGGNITVSPLSFLDSQSMDPVILELSSWQLADIQDLRILVPQISLITNILHDHMNHYANFEEYINDKKRIYASQSKEQHTLCNFDDPRGRGFYEDTPATPWYFSGSTLSVDGFFLNDKTGYASVKGEVSTVLSPDLSIKGEHNRINLLCAAACSYLYGADTSRVRERLARFTGIPHRMEFLGKKGGIRYYNDSAATIPQAAMSALQSFSEPVHIICGGTDKECDFSGFAEALSHHHVYLLEGTATDIFINDLKNLNIPYFGPFNSLNKAFLAASHSAVYGDVILLSPGATSFGMFLNEFDRGNQYRELVNSLDN